MQIIRKYAELKYSRLFKFKACHSAVIKFEPCFTLFILYIVYFRVFCFFVKTNESTLKTINERVNTF